MTAPVADPLGVLREYRQLAPWSLRDLATVVASLLDASAVRPVSAVASTHPNERTIRFYVTKGLVAPPEGRGTSATYTYRHLLQVLSIKLRQMEGATLEVIAREHGEMPGDVLERRVAGALGPGLPAPQALELATGRMPRGRAGRTLKTNALKRGADADPGIWHRLPIESGVELHVQDTHPLAGAGEHGDDLRDALRAVILQATRNKGQ